MTRLQRRRQQQKQQQAQASRRAQWHCAACHCFLHSRPSFVPRSPFPLSRSPVRCPQRAGLLREGRRRQGGSGTERPTTERGERHAPLSLRRSSCTRCDARRRVCLCWAVCVCLRSVPFLLPLQGSGKAQTHDTTRTSRGHRQQTRVGETRTSNEPHALPYCARSQLYHCAPPPCRFRCRCLPRDRHASSPRPQ
jgi:hypothetical protein